LEGSPSAGYRITVWSTRGTRRWPGKTTCRVLSVKVITIFPTANGPG
jgi:hypothetical protein